MADDSEEACLVNPKSTSGGLQYTEGTAQPSIDSNKHSSRRIDTSIPHQNNDNSDQYDINDEIILSQFHADAIKQAGCGKFQFLASLIVGLGLAANVIQVYSVFYIIPSVEVEYCILDAEKNWLGHVTFLGIGFGALLWGALAGRSGRRKMLLSCLAVSGVFSVIAAFMPTYGPFMMARFCSAIGIGGAFPAAASYICEITPLSSRARAIAFLSTLGVGGGIFAGAVAMQVVPLTGQSIVTENKEHFSAWHRYLLLMTIIPIISTILLCWLPESPRWLLASGNEVEALTTYQKIYKSNRSKGGYALTELELPGIRGRRISVPSTVLASMIYYVKSCCNTFVQLFNEKNRKTTFLLLAAWTVAMFVFHGLTIYISEYSKAVEQGYYNGLTLTKFNETFENVNFHNSLDNMIYDHCRFRNCTFRRLFISHVTFKNSSFTNTEFSYVKTSRTIFINSTLDEIKFIDTDITKHNLINCAVKHTIISRLNGTCDMDFEYNVFVTSIWKANLGGLIPCILAILSVGEAIQRLGRATVATFCFVISMILSVILGFVVKDEIVIWIGGCAQGFILAALTALTLFVIETYTTSIRCTALGVFVCGCQIGAIFGVILYSSLPTETTKFAATISTISMIIPVISAMVLKDPCLLV